MGKYLINIYNIINERVSTDKMVIYKDIMDSLENIKKGEGEINIFCYLKDMINKDKRLRFLMGIEKLDMDMEKKKMIEIVNYMVLNNGEIKKIKNFDIVQNNIEKIKLIGREEMMRKDLEEERFICEKEIEKADNDVIKIKYITRLVYMFNLMEEEIDRKEKYMEKDLENIIIESREEDENTIRNELDLLNNVLKKKLSKEEMRNLEIKKCIYNGVELSHEQLVEELMYHMFPEYMKEKNIEDTLEDVYEIETNIVTIKRSEGGNIKIKKVMKNE